MGVGVCAGCTFDASAYPVVRPSVAVVASPVARILAEFATPGRRDFCGIVRCEFPDGGGGGRRGSFIISRPLLRLRDHRGLRRGAHLSRHRHHRRDCVAAKYLKAGSL